MGGLDAAPCAGSLSGNHGSATPSIRSQHPGNHIMAGGAGDAPSLAASKGHFARSGKNAVTARYHDCKSDSSESGSSSGLTAVRMGRVTYVVGFLSGRHVHLFAGLVGRGAVGWDGGVVRWRFRHMRPEVSRINDRVWNVAVREYNTKNR